MAEALNIDEIVREVVRQIQAISRSAAAPSLSASIKPSASAPAQVSPPSVAKASAPQQPTTLTFSDRLVTLAALEGKLNGVQQLVVARKAIVTPAVKDDLKRRGIAIVHHDSVSSQNTTIRLLAAAANNAINVAVRANLAQATQGVEWLESHGTQSLAGAVAELAKHVINRKLPGLLLTAQPIAAALLANRNPNIRAATVTDVRSLDEALAQIGANLIAVDPQRVGPAVLNIIAQKLAASQPVAPPQLEAK